MIDVRTPEGKPVMTISDQADGKGDMIIVDGKEVPYMEAALAAEEKKAKK